MKRDALIGALLAGSLLYTASFLNWGAENGKETSSQKLRPQTTGQATRETKADSNQTTEDRKEGRHSEDGIDHGLQVRSASANGRNSATGKGNTGEGRGNHLASGTTGGASGNDIGILGPKETSRSTGTESLDSRLPGRGDRNDGRRLIGTFKLTAYTAGPESTGKSPGHPLYGHVAISGSKLADFQPVKVEEGRTIATDWGVLKPGTVVWIEGIGRRVVEDKGGAVRGKHIDVYIEDLATAKEFGDDKRAKVYILEEGA